MPLINDGSIEATLQFMKEYVTDESPTFKYALEAERSLTIPEIALVDTCEVLIPQYFMIQILPSNTRIAYTSAPLNDGWQTHYLAFVFSQCGSDIKKVQLDLFNWRTILMRMIKADSSFGGLFNLVALLDSEYFPVDKDNNLFTQDLYQTISVRNLL